MYVPSLSESASGPPHTYSSGGHHTTIDYFLATNDCASLISHCTTIDDHPLNTSDHLPLSLTLDISCTARQRHPLPSESKINWRKGAADRSVRAYCDFVSNLLQHTLANPPCNSAEQLDTEIQQVCEFIKKGALSSHPIPSQSKNSHAE